MGRGNGVTDEQLLTLAGDPVSSPLFDAAQQAALEYAERITRTDDDVDDLLFARLRTHFTDAQVVELTCTVAFENFLSKFHHALLVDGQGFCTPRPQTGDDPLDRTGKR